MKLLWKNEIGIEDVNWGKLIAIARSDGGILLLDEEGKVRGEYNSVLTFWRLKWTDSTLVAIGKKNMLLLKEGKAKRVRFKKVATALDALNDEIAVGFIDGSVALYDPEGNLKWERKPWEGGVGWIMVLESGFIAACVEKSNIYLLSPDDGNVVASSTYTLDMSKSVWTRDLARIAVYYDGLTRIIEWTEANYVEVGAVEVVPSDMAWCGDLLALLSPTKLLILKVESRNVEIRDEIEAEGYRLSWSPSCDKIVVGGTALSVYSLK